jgi:phosphoribosylformylglycinamidine synthase
MPTISNAIVCLQFCLAKILAVVIQAANDDAVSKILLDNNIRFIELGETVSERQITVAHKGKISVFDIDSLRDTWFKSSYLLDRKQCGEDLAKKRFDNYKYQPLHYSFPKDFTGTYKQYAIDPERKEVSGTKAAIIREKGVNGDREMAYALHLAGFDVYDVHMTDLISGRETLEDKQMIVFVGGFSNSDVLGSAKGWAGAFLYNEKAKTALDNFYKRNDTLSLGVCNGCQLMIELGLIDSNAATKPKMSFNDSHKFESIFLNVSVPQNNSVMLSSLAGSRLGIWVAHGEGKFNLSGNESDYSIAMKYSHSDYPANPNGSHYDVAGLCSKDGRHLAMMPHLERAIFPFNWAYYQKENANNEITPWIEAFVNARKWIEKK